MPYANERAGLKALKAIDGSGVVDKFRAQLKIEDGLPQLPAFVSCPPGKQRRFILAIDGSWVYEAIPGSLPCTEAGLVTLGVVVIDTKKLEGLERLPESGAVNPKELQDTEKGGVEPVMLPGMNAARIDGASPRRWFREIVNTHLEKINLGGESFAETLGALLRKGRRIRCPNPDCDPDEWVGVPEPNKENACPVCKEPVWLGDGLRIHEQFEENASVTECHSRFMDALEILALMNAVRHLAGTEEGRRAIAHTAFVKDGPLAAFGTIAALAQGVRAELRRIDSLLGEGSPRLLVMSGIKSGPFVRHSDELDRGPEPGTRIEPNHVWLPDDDHIRSRIVAGDRNHSKAWGELTYFGRPVILKTVGGKRLVLNLAQPEADPPLTNAPQPRVLGDALATASPFGIGADQFAVLRRSHAQAAIPFKAGGDLIKSLAS